jgi:hypothetical protein
VGELDEDFCPCIPMPVHLCWPYIGVMHRAFWAIAHMEHTLDEMFEPSPLMTMLMKDKGTDG